MAKYSMLDSSSDYDYDLSADDEAQLYQLVDTPTWIASGGATLRTRSTAGPSTGAGSITSAVPPDSVSEDSSRLNDAALDPGFAYAHEPRLLVGDDKVPFYTGGKAPAVADRASLRNSPAYSTVADDVSYPDCSSRPCCDPSRAPLTDFEAASESSLVEPRVRGYRTFDRGARDRI